MKRWLTLLALIAGSTLTAGIAVAQEAESPPDTVTIERHTSYGALWASGSGSATLDVRRAWVGMRVEGDVSIEGNVHRLLIDGTESSEAVGDGTKVHLTGFAGTIVVVGAHYTVDIQGDVSLHGIGSGKATFRGEGWWRTLHKRGLWAGSDPIPDLDQSR